MKITKSEYNANDKDNNATDMANGKDEDNENNDRK